MVAEFVDSVGDHTYIWCPPPLPQPPLSYFPYSYLKAKSSRDQSILVNQHHADKSLKGAKILYLK